MINVKIFWWIWLHKYTSVILDQGKVYPVYPDWLEKLLFLRSLEKDGPFILLIYYIRYLLH